jgi:hypothetical protein
MYLTMTFPLKIKLIKNNILIFSIKPIISILKDHNFEFWLKETIFVTSVKSQKEIIPCQKY